MLFSLCWSVQPAVSNSASKPLHEPVGGYGCDRFEFTFSLGKVTRTLDDVQFSLACQPVVGVAVEVVVLETPSRFMGDGGFYEQFEQVSDEEAMAYLESEA